MKDWELLGLDEPTRRQVWEHLIKAIESYRARIDDYRVTPELSLERIRSLVEEVNFEHPMKPLEAIDFVVDGLWKHQVHTPHPRYFGLYNPNPTTMGIAADTLVAAFNPQLAAWSHSPFANEIESYLARSFGERFGYDPKQTDGAFTSGGAEANHTAILTALEFHFPEMAAKGLRGLEKQPVMYATSESHHSLLKAAKLCGLGTEALREIPTNDNLQMDVDALSGQIAQDKRKGDAPFMVIATGGTTNAGVIDPIREIAEIAERESLWFHVDAAWGGAAAFDSQLRAYLSGIERSDSIIIDPHKWLSVPMGAGIYITRHPDILSRTFRVTTHYMPKEAAGMGVNDPYAHTIQWSRRFIGLKVFLSLAVAGWEGYARAISHQSAMGDLLRAELEKHGWEIVSHSPFAVVCFCDQEIAPEAIVARVLASGDAWISTTKLKDKTVIRACITNYRTEPDDIHSLVNALNRARE